MFVHWPKTISDSAVRTNLVYAMDILPTVIDAAHGELPMGLDGKSLLPVLGSSDVVIHDHLLWAGMHAYKWGYLITKSAKVHSNESAFAPPGWVVVKDDYLLRFTGTREPNIYYDHMAGREPMIELFDLKKDPAESNNLANELPEKVEELRSVFKSESKDFPEPKDWPITRYNELMK